MQGIYAITCVPTGEQYIGQARNIARRWAQHKSELNAGTHISAALTAAWQIHGAEAFSWTVLENVEDAAMLTQTERDYICRLCPRFNTLNAPSHLPVGLSVVDRRITDLNHRHRRAYYVMRQDESNEHIWSDIAGPFNSRRDAFVALEYVLAHQS